MTTNLVQYLHDVEAAPGGHPEAAQVLASKMREALDVTNEMARLVIRYQGLLDRHTMCTADAAGLRAALGELAAGVALRVGVLAELPDGRVEMAVHAVGLGAVGVREVDRSADDWRYLWLAWKCWADTIVVPAFGTSGPESDPAQRSKIGQLARRGPLSRDEALAIGCKHAPGNIVYDPHIVDGLKTHHRVEPWMVDAIIEAASRRPDEHPRPPLTREEAIALAQRHVEGLAPATYEGEAGRAIGTWVIDAIVEASR